MPSVHRASPLGSVRCTWPVSLRRETWEKAPARTQNVLAHHRLAQPATLLLGWRRVDDPNGKVAGPMVRLNTREIDTTGFNV